MTNRVLVAEEIAESGLDSMRAAGLDAIDGVTCAEPEGAFYAFPSFEGVLGREIAGSRPTTTLELAGVRPPMSRPSTPLTDGYT